MSRKEDIITNRDSLSLIVAVIKILLASLSTIHGYSSGFDQLMNLTNRVCCKRGVGLSSSPRLCRKGTG